MARCQIKGCTQSAICEVDFSEPSRRFLYTWKMNLTDYVQPVTVGDTFTIAFPSKPTNLCYYHDKRVKNLIGDPASYGILSSRQFSELITLINPMHNVGGEDPFSNDEGKRPNTQIEQADFRAVDVAPGTSDPHMVEDQVLGAIDNGCLQGVINWHLRTRWWSLVETSQTLQEFSDSRLSDIENRILYKFDPIHGEAKTLKDIALEERRMGLTYANVRQIKARAVKKKGEGKFKYYPFVDYAWGWKNPLTASVNRIWRLPPQKSKTRLVIRKLCLPTNPLPEGAKPSWPVPSVLVFGCYGVYECAPAERELLGTMTIEIHKEKKIKGIWTFNNNSVKKWYEKNVPKQLIW